MNHFLTATGAAGMSSSIIMLVAMLAIFYFMLIRPENKCKGAYLCKCGGHQS